METQTLPSKAQVKSHGSLLRELKNSDDYIAQNIEGDEEFKQLKDYLSSASSDIKVTKASVPLESFMGLKEIKKEILGYLEKSASAQFAFDDGDYEFNDRILIFGAGGTGKTHLVRAIATELNANVIEFGVPAVFHKWESSMESFTKAMYEICREKGSTTVLFLNHLETFCSGDEEKRAMVRFLRSVQSVWQKNDSEDSSPPSRLVIFASTKKPNLLEEKVIYGFDQRIYIPTLNVVERKRLFQRMIQTNWKLGHVMTPKDLDFVSRKTFGILTTEIEPLVDKAIRVQYPPWFCEEGSSNEFLRRQGSCKDFKWRALEVGDFIEVLRGFVVLNPKSFSEFETFQQKFGNGPFMSMHAREDYDENAPGKKEKKKGRWVWTAFAWL